MAQLCKKSDGSLCLVQYCPGCNKGGNCPVELEGRIFRCDFCDTRYRIVNDGDWHGGTRLGSEGVTIGQAPTVICSWCKSQKPHGARFCPHCRLDSVGIAADQGAWDFGLHFHPPGSS